MKIRTIILISFAIVALIELFSNNHALEIEESKLLSHVISNIEAEIENQTEDKAEKSQNSDANSEEKNITISSSPNYKKGNRFFLCLGRRKRDIVNTFMA